MGRSPAPTPRASRKHPSRSPVLQRRAVTDCYAGRQALNAELPRLHCRSFAVVSPGTGGQITPGKRAPMLGKWPNPNKLSEMSAWARGLWIRRVLVRAQEGQWLPRQREPSFLGLVLRRLAPSPDRAQEGQYGRRKRGRFLLWARPFGSSPGGAKGPMSLVDVRPFVFALAISQLLVT